MWQIIYKYNALWLILTFVSCQQGLLRVTPVEFSNLHNTSQQNIPLQNVHLRGLHNYHYFGKITATEKQSAIGQFFYLRRSKLTKNGKYRVQFNYHTERPLLKKTYQKNIHFQPNSHVVLLQHHANEYQRLGRIYAWQAILQQYRQGKWQNIATQESFLW